MSKVIVKIEKNGAENNLSVLRKFSKKVRESGVLKRVRSIRYNERAKSKYVKKKKTLTLIAKKNKIEDMLRLGKNLEILKRKK